MPKKTREGEIALAILKHIKGDDLMVASVEELREDALKLSAPTGIKAEEILAFLKKMKTEKLRASLKELDDMK